MSRKICALVTLLGFLHILILSSCGSSSSQGITQSTSIQSPVPTSSPSLPTATPLPATECGFVHYGPPGLSPANYRELINCFLTNFQQCHPANFVYEFFSTTDQGHNVLTLSGTAGKCKIGVVEHYTTTSTVPPTNNTYKYSCGRFDEYDGHLVIQDCSNGFLINFP